MLYRHFGKPIFFKMDPETAHHLVIGGLNKADLVPGGSAAMRLMYGVPETADLAVDLFGVHFPTPVGLAAGLDKNAEAVGGFSSIGFGFMEVGTVTPVGQPGNDSPRLFRLLPDKALINRMGFNNEGAEAMAERLKRLKKRRIPVAVNIGRNKATPNELAHEDYRKCIRTLYPYGDFLWSISARRIPRISGVFSMAASSRTCLARLRKRWSCSGRRRAPRRGCWSRLLPMSVTLSWNIWYIPSRKPEWTVSLPPIRPSPVKGCRATKPVRRAG